MKIIKGEGNTVTVIGEGEIIIARHPHKPSFDIKGFDNWTLQGLLRQDQTLFIKHPCRKWWQFWKPRFIAVNAMRLPYFLT